MNDEFESAWKKRPWETESRTDKDRAWFWWQAARAAPAQGEPVAWVVYAPNGNVRLWSQTGDVAMAYAEARDLTCTPLYAAILSSPAPLTGSLPSGESEPSVTTLVGAGEAIFEECAEIALEHVAANTNGGDQSDAYDEACRDIAEAIRTRASNRKTMDALANDGRNE